MKGMNINAFAMKGKGMSQSRKSCACSGATERRRRVISKFINAGGVEMAK